MHQKHITVHIEAPYCTLNELSPCTKRIWLVCHGYGMLARYFIKKFDKLDQLSNYIIAPQGLSKHYLDGFRGRVGATWMTKEDRETEINNQVRYLQTILDNELKGFEQVPITLFGFSQGASTVSRFAAFGNVQFDRLILWAGEFPPDLDSEALDHWPKDLDVTVLVGDQDPFINQEKINQQVQLVEVKLGRKPKVVHFEGVHEVVSDLLLTI
ncbi:MAG: putative esterase [Cyclobacteriaceae bacterium]|jgi:predicted esterase